MNANSAIVVIGIRDALLNEGSRPDVHRAQLDRLRVEWPTLYRAVIAALNDNERRQIGQGR